MAKKSLAKNYIYNLIYEILIMILPLITVPYISRVIGAEGIGIYSYTISITTYFITFGSLGVALYGQREVAVHQDDKKKYSKLFYEIIIFRFITLFISMFIFFFAFVLGNNEYNLYYKILMLELLSGVLDIGWFFKGHEDFKKIVMRSILVRLISITCIFLFVKTPNDLWLYILIYALSVFVGNISLWFYLPQYLVKVNIKELNIIQHIKPTIALFIPQIAIQVYTLLDKTMIGTIISDKSEVGYYDQAQRIIKLLLTVITSMGAVMMPRVAYTYSKGDKEQVKTYINNSFKLVFMISLPMIFGVFLVADEFVPFFFGEGYEPVSMLMKVISPILLFIGMSNVTGTQYLLPIKRTSQYTMSVVAGAITNFIMNMLLIPKYGALGASIGTITAEFVVTFVQLMYVRKDLNILNIIDSGVIYFNATLFMFIIGFIIGKLLTPSLLTMLIQVIVCAIIYLIILIVIKDELIIGIKKRVFKR